MGRDKTRLGGSKGGSWGAGVEVTQADDRRGLDPDGGDRIRGESWRGETESLKSAAREEKKK